MCRVPVAPRGATGDGSRARPDSSYIPSPAWVEGLGATVVGMAGSCPFANRSSGCCADLSVFLRGAAVNSMTAGSTPSSTHYADAGVAHPSSPKLSSIDSSSASPRRNGTALPSSPLTQIRKPADLAISGLLSNPAATYFPTALPRQYHGPWRT